MSPALVDPCTHAAATAPPPWTLPKQTPPPPWNPRIVGEALPDVVPPAIPSSSDRLRTPTAAMDPMRVARGAASAGIPGERNLESVFSMLFPPPKADRAPPAPPPGLSKPRFVKVRRHFASPRVRPGPAAFADSEDVADPGFNPFRWGPPPAGDVSSVDRGAAERADRSSSGRLGCAESEGVNFAFGRSSNLDWGESATASVKDGGFTFTSGGNGNSGGFEPARSENANFVFGHSTTGSPNPSHLKSSVPGDTGNASCKPVTAGSWSSASEETVSSASTFDFGPGARSSYFDERGTAAQSENSKEEGTCSSSGVFLFESGSKKSVVSDQNVADGFDKSAAGKLPEEMQKLNIRVSGNADNIETAKSGDHSLEAGDGATFVFDTNKNVSGSFSESNFTEGVFVFGSSLKKCSIPDLSSTDGSDNISMGKLSEEIRKLNIKDSTMKNWSTENVNRKFTTTGICSSGAQAIPNASMFDFGRLAKHSNFDETMTSRLPDEMRKLNIEVPSGVDGFGKMKGPSYSSEVDQEKIFTFGSNQNIGSSHENYTSELLEELKTVNSRRGTTHQPESGNEEGMTSSSGVFVFESNSKKSTAPDQNAADSFDKSATGKLPEEMQKLNIRGSGNADSVGKSRGGNSSLDAHGGGCAFGSSENVSGSFVQGNSTARVFVFGSSSKKSNVPDFSKKSNVPDLSAFDGSDKRSLTNNSGTSAFESNKNVSVSFGESKSSSGYFVFGSSSSQGTNSCRGAFDGFDQGPFKFPDEMQKLGSGNSSCLEKSKGGDYSTDNSAFVFGSKKDSSASSGETNSTAGIFVFGSSSNRSTAYNEGMADLFVKGNKLRDEMQELNIRGSMDNDNSEKTKSVDCKPMANDSGSFVLADDKNTSASSGNDYSSIGTSTSLRFSFHATNQDGSSGVGGVPPAPADCYARSMTDTNASSCSSSFGSISQSSFYDSAFTGHCEGLGTRQMNFRTKKQDASSYSKDSFVQCQNVAFNVKKGVFSHSRSKKKRGKLRESTTHSQRGGKAFVSRGKGSQENSEMDSTGDYSPMDFSPCQLETSVAEECSREVSVASEESIDFSFHHSSTDIQNSVSGGPTDEDLAHATECLEINEEYLKHELHDGDMKPHAETCMAAEPSFVGEDVSGLGYRVFLSKTDLQSKNDSSDAGVNTMTDFFSSEFEKQSGDGGSGFTFASCSNGISESGFTFAASPSTQGSFSASKHSHRKKFRTKVGRDPHISNSNANVHFPSTAQLFPDVSTSSQLYSTKAQTGVPSVSQSQGLEGKRLEKNKKPEVRQESISMAAASIAAQEVCEKWRLRGNQAYANGDLSKAEEYYTHGVNSISPVETSKSCTRALMLCYSNRAATRMSIGKIREALCDCMMAAAIDPGFLRAQLRAANCHLQLGEIEDACSHFKKCLPKGSELCMDRKFVLEASDGLQKAKQVADYIKHATALLRKRTTNDATSAVQIISDALSLCPYSENLIEMKAEALLTLWHYDELIQLCDQTLDSAELNSSLSSDGDQFNDRDNSSRLQTSPARAWRCYLKSRAYFCLGRLEEALSLLQEQEQVEGITDRCGSKFDALTLLSATVRELLRLKIAGNTAFNAGRHSEAVEHYTAALAYNIESRPFAAVCFCNRAATYQALGQITDAISDCSSAIALDPNYPKAISRRATLHEMIRDYGQAGNDLCRLVSLLEGKLEDKSGGKMVTINGDDPELARLRLAKVEEKARKEIPLDMYMILGIETSSDAAEIKKAYRKAALRHHPDKAGLFLVRSENVNEGLWKEVADEVHRDADHLFKIIGEAYAVLSEPSKRLQYDTEEEIRTTQKGNSGASTPRTQSDFHSSHFERSSGRWQSRDHWKSYGSSNHRWSGSYRTNRYF